MTFIWILPPPIIFAENFSYISENLTIHEPMNKPRVIFLVFAILWAVIDFNELKKFKKEE